MSSLFQKRIKHITFKDIQSLAINGVPEDRQLDYKKELHQIAEGSANKAGSGVGKNDGKKKFLQLVSAFANTMGGDIVYGVGETNDGEQNIPDPEIKGVEKKDAADFEDRVSSLVKDNLEPSLTGFDFHRVEIPETGKIVLILRIYPSLVSPHLVKLETAQFYVRAGNATHPMDMHQIREAMLGAFGFEKKARAFHKERMDLLLNREGLRDFNTGPFILLHVIPASALADEFSDTVPLKIEGTTLNTELVSFGCSTVNCLEGLALVQDQLNGRNPKEGGYNLFFRSGVFEVASNLPIRAEHGQQTLLLKEFSSRVPATLKKASELLEEMGFRHPHLFLVTVVNARGLRPDPESRSSMTTPWGRDLIPLQASICHDSEERDSAAKQVTRSLWWAFGFEDEE